MKTVENFEREFRLISTLLAGIPEEQAEVIRLRIHGNNSFSDIAAILDIPVTTAKSHSSTESKKSEKESNPKVQNPKNRTS